MECKSVELKEEQAGGNFICWLVSTQNHEGLNYSHILCSEIWAEEVLCILSKWPFEILPDVIQNVSSWEALAFLIKERLFQQSACFNVESL